MRGDPKLEIGGIARAHGIRGEVMVYTHDPDSEILGEVAQIWVGGVERTIAEARPSDKGWLVRFDGVTTRTEAEHLRGQVVEIAREHVELDDGEVLLDDLIGCKCLLPDGTEWGTIASVEVGSAQDLLVIHDGEIERMLPLVDQFVTKIDVAAGTVSVDPPPGLPESKR